MLTTIRTASYFPFPPSEDANSCRTASRDETASAYTRCRNTLSTMMVGVKTQYHYSRATRERRKSENSCRNCGNLAPSLSKVFRNMFIRKDLDLTQNGTRLANCVAPARVRLYWCPKSLSC